MNVFNRQTVIEDSVHYFVHLGTLASNKNDALAFATLFKSYVALSLTGHIWHRDPFELNVLTDEEGQFNLRGIMRMGDCIDDEWCVVWLLRDISRRWDVAIRIHDSDGDFLLIEAANTLPSWITPENAENRVWIYRGRLHIVPLKYVSSQAFKSRRVTQRIGERSEEDIEETEIISRLEAVGLVRNPDIDTLTSPEVEKAAFERTEKYPDAARQHVHHTKAYLPREIAMALFETPELVQKAVEAFYMRDALQMRAAARMARFSPVDSVLATIKLTRTAYAQLISQPFYPPRSFGIWKEPEGSIERRRKDIGMKIACGFEMVYQENKNRSHLVSDVNNVRALRDDLNYQQYIGKLKKVGFFGDVMESSHDWELCENYCAAEYFQNSTFRKNSRPSFSNLVDSAIARAKKHLAASEKIDFAAQEEDSDQWLLDAEHAMEEIIANYSNTTTPIDIPSSQNKEELMAEKQATQLHHLANEVEKFVEGEGDIEGALFNDRGLTSEVSSSISDRDSDGDSMADSADEHFPVFAERQAALDELVPPIDQSDYGKMPASYHNNSQKVKESLLEFQDAENIDTFSNIPPSGSGKIPAQTGPIRPLLFPRDEFDGAEDSDDESDVEVEEDEENPTLVGEIEVDMENEKDEFLEFSRDVLKITPDLWNSIVKDRQKRGAFVPTMTHVKETREADTSHFTSEGRPEELKEENTRLNSFETVMDALDLELQRVQEKNQERCKATTSASNLMADRPDEIDLNIQEVTADELLMVQENNNEEHMDYTLIKNFLESFKSQQGLSGPVSSLLGRLGGQLPRDTS
ncbi:hypothetical protein Clacol_003691 [Clathrus columnatus]|uniref:SGT1-domain-containing protein n=1 Tax=Clathrus columnatus TaxID=1419009 RepID=A0AAV5A7M4_9AGAM|nr:hypothetical protein Clacol_003691 [Clathrus columnatus]